MSAETEGFAGEDWQGDMGRRWLDGLDRFESMIAPVGQAALDHADFRPGERVIDIGCGGGGTTLAIARAVAPGGEAFGLDISPDLVRSCTARAAAAGLTNVRFVCADASVARPEGAPFDRMFSRFGSMFFAEPGAAFANLHAMLKPGGRIDLAVWGAPQDNVWMMRMREIVSKYIEMPPPDPRAPGPFAFADPDYMREVLAAGGFRDAGFTIWEGEQPVGGAGAEPHEAAAFLLGSMAFADQIREAGGDVADRLTAELTAGFAAHYRPGEGVMLAAKAWLVSATA